MSTIIEADNLKAYYITKAYGVERTVKAVDNISLKINEGEVYGIAGESGCGKSTLLKVLLGEFEPPLTVVDGSVTYHLDNQEIDSASMSKAQRRNLRWKKISYIPQGSMHVLNPVRRIRATFHDFISAHLNVTKAESLKMTQAYLSELGLPEKVLNSFPHQLSGGMRQRVTIALATILWPNLIFADEPTTALDVVVQRGVIQLLREIQQKKGSTLILITHDMGVHANLADRIAILYAGKIVEEGTTRTILKNPRHPYTQFLIRSLPNLDERVERVSIPGRPPALDNPPSGCRFHERCPLAMDKCLTIEPEMIQIDETGHRTACHVVTEELSHATN
ncbi:ABC transporter ATP-binding protein [Phototrophicus methaneseepsis]|uniref:ABC transporter ATP-binding protein n=1 Tax=Phototrophicus methaneseepsis TaxID=2710758 RepID=A0A7S8ECY5_9CHLR|nr:ABC transporter ATP-binding protein [Phototrophicus methaneseepsis]QPC84680.1 ABC transporter ATP-binding protein [Phototrophicus methaneseepsis]